MVLSAHVMARALYVFFSCRNKSFWKLGDRYAFCLEANKNMHITSCQVYWQMKLCHVTYYNFIIWKDDELVGIRVDIDEDFLADAIYKATIFFKQRMLPELVGKWYTRPLLAATATSQFQTLTSHKLMSMLEVLIWCYCNRGKLWGNMFDDSYTIKMVSNLLLENNPITDTYVALNAERINPDRNKKSNNILFINIILILTYRTKNSIFYLNNNTVISKTLAR